MSLDHVSSRWLQWRKLPLVAPRHRYAGGNTVAFTVGWVGAVALLLALDHFVPERLHSLQRTAPRIYLSLLAFELAGLLMQARAPPTPMRLDLYVVRTPCLA